MEEFYEKTLEQPLMDEHDDEISRLTKEISQIKQSG